MNRKQLQLSVCRAILDKNTRAYKAEINNNEIIITTTGFDAFCFDKSECVFDIDKIPTRDALKDIIMPHVNDELLKPTGQLFNRYGKLLEKFEGENCECYIDTKLLKPFSGLDLYGYSSNHRIVAKDRFKRIVGIVLPFKFVE